MVCWDAGRRFIYRVLCPGGSAHPPVPNYDSHETMKFTLSTAVLLAASAYIVEAAIIRTKV